MVHPMVDSGAGTTILDVSFLYKMGLSETDPSTDSETYRTANGELFQSLGKLDVTLVIDSIETRRTVVFAKLGSEYGLLGMDYLEQYDCVLHFSSGQLEVAGHGVALHKPCKVPGCRVSLADDARIPPRSYSVLQGYLAKSWSQDDSPVTAFVEPSPARVVSDGLHMLPGYIDVYKSLVPLMVVNTSDRHVKLKKGTLLGIAHPSAEHACHWCLPP